MQGLSLSTIGRVALDMIYPPRCAICGTNGTFLCSKCIEALPRAEGLRCERCWQPLLGSQCYRCTEHPPHLESLRSVFRFDGESKRLIYALKLGGQSSLAPSLARLLSEAYEQHGLVADAIVPVPLTGARRRSRGYNQSQLVATELSKLTGVPVVEALRRNGHGNSQHASRSAEERRRNVEGVFNLAKGHDVAGMRLLLIDDVATTGATLNACAAVLLAGGALNVGGLTLARDD